MVTSKKPDDCEVAESILRAKSLIDSSTNGKHGPTAEEYQKILELMKKIPLSEDNSRGDSVDIVESAEGSVNNLGDLISFESE